MSKITEGVFRDMRKGEKDEKIFTFIASTSAPDRHRTVLNQAGWELDNFNANPIIGYQHNVYGDGCSDPHPDDVIGKGRAYLEDGKLMLDSTFDTENEKAMKIESKIERGFLTAVSVGFREVGEGHRGIEENGEDKNLYYFAGQELVEVSVVNIPSNPDAKKRSLRSQTFDALKYIYRELGGDLKFSEIEDMKVGDVIKMLGGEEKKNVKDVKIVENHKGQIQYKIVRKRIALVKGNNSN